MCWAEILPFDITPAVAALLGLGALVAAVLVVPVGRWLFGPLAALELTRAAHNRRLYLLRVTYAVALLVALFATFPTEATLQTQAMEAFANQFSTLFLLIQSSAMLLLTPIVFGSAISGEKENRSLDFLLVTPLSAAEIVLGKYVGWFLNLMGVLLTGLPILALTVFWGGVDLGTLFSVFAAQAIAVLSFGAIAICCSVLFERSIQAVVCAAILTALIALGCVGRLLSPIGIQAAIEQMHQFPTAVVATGPVGRFVTGPSRLLGFFGLAHGVLATLCLGLSILCLRRRARRSEPQFAYAGGSRDLNPVAPHPFARTMISASPIRGDALLWRERHLGYLSDPYFDTFWLYYAGFLVLLTIASWALPDSGANWLIRKAFRWSAALSAAGFYLVSLMRLASCISRERQQRTLESLLSLPISRGRVLCVKWLGAVIRSNRWAGALVAGLMLGTVSSAFRPLEAVVLLLLALAWAAFVSGVSLLTSVVARTTLRANVIAIVAVIAVLAVTTIDARFRGLDAGSTKSYVAASRDALSPYYACRMAADIRIADKDLIATRLAPLVSAALLYLAAGAALVAVAFWRFRREERYT